jgi:hypothetical protein
MSKAREFVELFTFASVHEDARYRARQGRVELDDLVRRCVDMAKHEGITEEQMTVEVGDLTTYFRAVIDGKNVAEAARLAADADADRKSGKS